MHLNCTTGAEFFLKYNSQVPKNFFRIEAQSLVALANTNGPRVPQVYHAEDKYIILEYIEAKNKAVNYWESFGRELAQMHNTCHDTFGFSENTYCGSTEQINDWHTDGHVFFVEHRLLHLARLNQDNGKLRASQIHNIESLCKKLDDLIPTQAASLIHGDLWSGNAHTDEAGQAVLIDPAVYYGWAEADLAMTTMFGSFPDVFYDAYIEARPLAQGWRERFPLYNLYHYLNHLHLFGASYLGEVLAISKRFA